MDIYRLSDLMGRQKELNEAYLEFLRIPSMSMGVYTLPAGSEDLQEPHTEDEVYYVTHGKAMMRIGSDYQQISAGSIIFVAANVAHCFCDISEDLTVLVFFAPAEYSCQRLNDGKED